MFQIFLLFFLNLFITPVKATNVTPTTDPKVKQFVEETLKPNVAKDKTSIDKTITSDTPKSFFGSITQISDKEILLNVQNQFKTLKLNEKITYVNAKRQKSKLSNFKVGQTILAMGYINEDESLDCRRIIATESKTIENNNQIVTGKIVDVSQSQSSPIFVLIPFQNKNGQYQIRTDSKTEIIDTTQKKFNSTDIIVNGKKIIAIIKPDVQVNQTFYASKIISLDANSESSEPSPTSKP